MADALWRETGRRFSEARVAIIENDGYNAFPSCVLMANGNLLIAYRKGTSHAADKGTIVTRTSSDDGATWSAETTVVNDGTYDARDPVLHRLSDDSLLMAYFLYDHTGGSMLLNGCRVITADATASSWSAEVTPTDGFTSVAGCSGTLAELDNGDLLLPVYGRNSGDSWDSAKVLTSSDGGSSWSVLSTLGDGETDGIHYQEPNLMQVPGGVLALIRRDDGSTGKNIVTRFSTDDGATWDGVEVAFAGSGSPRTRLVEDRAETLYRNYPATQPTIRSFVAGAWGQLDIVSGFGGMQYGEVVDVGNGQAVAIYATAPSGSRSDVYAQAIRYAP